MVDYAAKIAQLEDALASGELTVEADGDRVTYRSVDDLLKALSEMRRLYAGQQSSARPASTVMVFSPGMNDGVCDQEAWRANDETWRGGLTPR